MEESIVLKSGRSEMLEHIIVCLVFSVVLGYLVRAFVGFWPEISNSTELWNKILAILAECFILGFFLYLVNYLFRRTLFLGRTIYLSPAGIRICFLTIWREYSWDDIQVKRFVSREKVQLCHRDDPVEYYKTFAEFSPYVISRTTCRRIPSPYYYAILYEKHIFDYIVAFYMSPDQIARRNEAEQKKNRISFWLDDKTCYPSIYKVDEAELREKLQRWGVEMDSINQ